MPAQSHFRLCWGCLSGVRVKECVGCVGGGRACYHSAKDVSIYRSCETCQAPAPCCQLARRAQHIESVSCSAHRAPPHLLESESRESFMFVDQPASACLTPSLFFFFFIVLSFSMRRFRSKTNRFAVFPVFWQFVLTSMSHLLSEPYMEIKNV